MKALLGYVTGVMLVTAGLFNPADAAGLTMQECIYRSEIALKVQKVVDAGTPLEKIELHDPTPVTSATQQAERDRFFADFKAEIAAASAALDSKAADHAERVAQKILESCAFRMGVEASLETERLRANHDKQAQSVVAFKSVLGGKVEALYRLASSISKLPMPVAPPEVVLTSHDAIEKLLTEIGVCPKGCPSVKMAQVENRIYIDEALDFDSIQVAAVLVHESVHHLQWAKDGEAQTCRQWVDREIIAYQMQNIVLNKANARMVQEPAWPECKE